MQHYTPKKTVDVQQLKDMLQPYPKKAIAQELILGFSQGFKFHYKGPKGPRDAKNLASTRLHPNVFREKVRKELRAGNLLGPFQHRPIPDLICSPMGLIPKKGNPGKFRMIMHLSSPTHQSINDFIPRRFCTVQYKSIDHAIALVAQHGRGAWMSRSDLESAYRFVPMHKTMLSLLGFTMDDQYYIDTMLPFGSSEACAIFEKFSSFIDWRVKHETGYEISHMLDDFFQVHSDQQECARLLQVFLDICAKLKFPVSAEKTVQPTQIIVYLGLLINSLLMVISIPKDKCDQALEIIREQLTTRKTTVRKLKSLTGFLNFLCKAIPPGRAFLRRIYDLMGALPNHYHVSITKQVKKDLSVWEQFISTLDHVRPIITLKQWNSDSLSLWTDSALRDGGGYGIFFQGHWAQNKWDQEFLNSKPSIALAELIPMVTAVAIWGHLIQNSLLTLFSDNQSAVAMINNSTSKCPLCMTLIRTLVTVCMHNNLVVRARYEPGYRNQTADALSRFQMQKFRRLQPHADTSATPIPASLWPISVRKLASSTILV